MLGERRKKLREGEINALLTEIRQGYDDYITHYKKSPKIREVFEDCYLMALRKNMDLREFFEAERANLRNLIAQTEATLARREAVEKKTPEIENLLNKIDQQTAEYPRRHLHAISSAEIEKLYGTTEKIRDEFWPQLDRFIAKFLPGRVITTRSAIDEKFWFLTEGGSSKIPNGLERYVALLSSNPRDRASIAKESRYYVQEVSLLLREILSLARKAERASNGSIPEEVARAVEYIAAVISDFRLGAL